ncbi:MAG: Com family DNA-binding transcriptional regulator [Desulfovibrio sp.]|nr:Com family DNA-binding transcriptional regulator [Desulfovibrio sp.]
MREAKEFRRGKCGKLLGKGSASFFEIKCPRCGTFNVLRDKISGSEPCDGHPEKTHETSR